MKSLVKWGVIITLVFIASGCNGKKYSSEEECQVREIQKLTAVNDVSNQIVYDFCEKMFEKPLDEKKSKDKYEELKAPEWVTIRENKKVGDKKINLYLDTNSVEIDSSIRTFWVKYEVVGKVDEYDVYHTKIDCENRQISTTESTKYKDNEATPQVVNPSWVSIVPESSGGSIYNIVCSK